jgi:hypothetical protein
VKAVEYEPEPDAGGAEGWPVEPPQLAPGKYALYESASITSPCTYEIWFDASACGWMLHAVGVRGGAKDTVCGYLQPDDCPGVSGLSQPVGAEAREWQARGQNTEPPRGSCDDQAPAFAFGVHFLETIQCGSRTCARYGNSFGQIPCSDVAASTPCFGPTEAIPCEYILCPEPPTCAWEVYRVDGATGLQPGCPGQDWTWMFDHGKQPPVPTCSGSPPTTAFGVEYTATEYNAEYRPCGRYGKSKPCDYLACLDFDTCEWILSEVKTNGIGDRTKCAGWGHEGEPVSP